MTMTARSMRYLCRQVTTAEHAARQECYPTEGADPQPLTNLLVWLKLSEQGLTHEQWQHLATMAPEHFPVSALKFPIMSSWIEHCKHCPVVLVLPADGRTLQGRLRVLSETPHPGVDDQLGEAGFPDATVLPAYWRYVEQKKAEANPAGPPFLRPELLLWDGAAYVRDMCQWANDEIVQVDGRLGYSDQDLHERVWVQRLNRGHYYVPLPVL